MTNGSPKSNVICDYWETPVIDSDELWLVNQLLTRENVYFFFHKNHDSPPSEYYVLAINGDDPFRITEEGLGWKVVGELLNNKVSSSEKTSAWPKTFKVWNTQFAEESFGALLITSEEYEKMEKFQYVIKTQDAWIQFVSFFETPKWEFHQHKKLDDLVIEYLRKDMLD